MDSSARRKLAIIAGICGVCGALGWGFYALVFIHQPAQDWMVFYTAARAYLEGNFGVVFDGERFTALLNARFAGWLSSPLTLHPWINPPIFLLLILPFALLPFGLSYALFQASGLALLLGALPIYAKERERWYLFAGAVVLCPAAALTIGAGQSSFLTGALFLAGFGFRTARPILAGLLLGMLAYKPQFCLMIPIALLAGRQWRVLAGAAIAGAALVLASVALFGVEPWLDWITFATGSNELYQNWAATSRLMGQSVYACAVMLGAPAALATIAQGAAAIFAGCGVYWCFRRPMPEPLRLAVLLVATLLAAPHVSWSDELLAAIAATLLLGVALDEGFAWGDAPMMVVVWLSAFVSPHNVFPIGRVIPLLLWCFIVWLIVRAQFLSRSDSGAILQPDTAMTSMQFPRKKQDAGLRKAS